MSRPRRVLSFWKLLVGQWMLTLFVISNKFYNLIGPGDTLNVIGEFDDQGKCIVDHDDNLVIIHLDILVSGTWVAASFTCPRRTILDEKLNCSEHSTAALIGAILYYVVGADKAFGRSLLLLYLQPTICCIQKFFYLEM